MRIGKARSTGRRPTGAEECTPTLTATTWEDGERDPARPFGQPPADAPTIVTPRSRSTPSPGPPMTTIPVPPRPGQAIHPAGMFVSMVQEWTVPSLPKSLNLPQ